jgi:hypothetical protein
LIILRQSWQSLCDFLVNDRLFFVLINYFKVFDEGALEALLIPAVIVFIDNDIPAAPGAASVNI